MGAVLTTALTFLIVPSFAHPEYPPQGDFDGDNIKNKKDICIEDSFSEDYHESCLERAGLSVPQKRDFDGAEQTYHTVLNRYNVPTTIISYENVQDVSYEEADIQTCSDLRNFRSDMRAKARNNRWTAWGIGIGGVLATALAIYIGGQFSGPAGVAAGVIVGLIVAAAITFFNARASMFHGYAESAQDVDIRLCARR